MKQLTSILCGALAAVCLAAAAAAQTPVQSQAAIPAGETSVSWSVPAGLSGPLLSLQARGLTNGATLAVSHLIPYTGGVLTNAIETAAAGDTLLVYPARYIAPVTSTYVTSDVPVSVTSAPPKPAWLGRGDSLVFTASAANGAAAVVVIRVAK